MSKRFVITLVTLLVIAGGAVAAVLLAKGYTFSVKEGRVVGTGIISVSSVPDGASVYIDGHLTTATNTTLSQLVPKSYTLKIIKEGFIPWEKTVEVKKGLVTEIKATLFPALPTLYPLTFNGAVNPLLSPDGQHLAFAVPLNADSHARQKGGIWIWTMSSQPISFNRGSEPHQIVASTTALDFSKAKLHFSPNSKQLLATLQEGDLKEEAYQRSYLLPIDRSTSISDLRDITPLLSATLKEWEEDLKAKDEARMVAIKDLGIRQIASDAATLRWSPDESKFLVSNSKPTSPKTSESFKVYDLLTSKDYDLPLAKSYFWLPDSLHLILVQEDKIAVSEFDGSNVAEVFAGKFEDAAVFPWPDSSRLIITTSFNTPTASRPNLFGINLK